MASTNWVTIAARPECVTAATCTARSASSLGAIPDRARCGSPGTRFSRLASRIGTHIARRVRASSRVAAARWPRSPVGRDQPGRRRSAEHSDAKAHVWSSTIAASIERALLAALDMTRGAVCRIRVCSAVSKIAAFRRSGQSRDISLSAPPASAPRPPAAPAPAWRTAPRRHRPPHSARSAACRR